MVYLKLIVSLSKVISFGFILFLIISSIGFVTDISNDKEGSLLSENSNENYDDQFNLDEFYNDSADLVQINKNFQNNKFLNEGLENDSFALEYSTYIGGNGDEHLSDMYVDQTNHDIYLCGWTTSNNFPLVDAYDSIFGGNLASDNNREGFLTKISASGQIIFSSYIGGSYSEDISNMYIDSSTHEIILSGTTNSADFPIVNAYDDQLNNGIGEGGTTDGFLTKFSSTGQILFSTYIGGSNYDTINQMAVNSEGIYISGVTFSDDFPTVNAYSSMYGSGDIFLTKFSTNGQTVLFSTYLGGSDNENINSMDLDLETGEIYISGATNSKDFPLKNAYNDIFSGSNSGFMTKFSSNGQNIIFSTYIDNVHPFNNVLTFIDPNTKEIYLAGAKTLVKFSPNVQSLIYHLNIGADHSFIFENTVPVQMFVDQTTKEVYLSGWTTESNMKTLNAYNSTYGGTYTTDGHYGDAFVAKISSTGQVLYQTFLGGSGREKVAQMVVNSNGEIYLCGWTTSENFPIKNAYSSTYKGSGFELGDIGEIFISKFSASGKSLIFSSYFGGSHEEQPSYLFIDPITQDIFIGGWTTSEDFPMKNAYNSTFGSNYNDNPYNGDMFLSKFSNIGDADFDGMPDFWENRFKLNTQLNDAYFDLDQDGLTNLQEYIYGTWPNASDTDLDGMNDLFEIQNSLDPLHDDSQLDKDSDGLNNLQEFTLGTSVNRNDTDFDTMDDYFEVKYHLNPLLDDTSFDHDFDGVSNLDEYLSHTNPNDFFSFPLDKFNYPSFILLIGILSLVTYLVYINYRRKRLIKVVQAPNYVIAKEIFEKGFPDFETYLEAKKCGAETMEIYKLILNSGASDIIITIDAINKGFSDVETYQKALELGAQTPEEYQKLLKSQPPSYLIDLQDKKLDNIIDKKPK